MTQCTFCKLEKEEQLHIFSNTDFFCIKDINPKANIHILIILREHIQNLYTDKDVFHNFHNTLREVLAKFSITRFILVCNNILNQEVPHIHFHILSDEKF